MPLPLSALTGRPVLLFCWAHWCPDCKAQIPALVKLQAACGPRGLVLIGPTQRYGASTVPTLVLVDRHGIVRFYHPGQMSYEELAPAVASAFAK